MVVSSENKLAKHAIWIAIAILGAFSLGYVALNRGETINAMWVLVASICIYLIGYRYYSLYIANKVLGVDKTRLTPAYRHNDGLDYVPTSKPVLFGHHFAAIAGAGPLVGPVLAAQMGYLPGMLWILAGVIFAGAVQDFMVLFVSTRRDGRSLGELIREEMGTIPGILALFACFMIMVIILAVLAMVVVNALADSPWGAFTVLYTIPLAIFMGIYLRYIRPGRILEISVIGFILLIVGIYLGQIVHYSETLSPLFNYDRKVLTWGIIFYGFIAAVLPVWFLLAPRDYLSTFLKIGAIAALAIGIIIVRPDMQMPAISQFADGSGPVWSGKLFPFLFITIACGAVSGFHALISSGTTPKMLENEDQARFIGYGGMLMESFVAIMALISASIIDPGVYFVMNSPIATLNPNGLADVVSAASQTVSNWGFVITPDALHELTKEVGENTIVSRTGGAPTLAIGMAQVLHKAFSGLSDMSFWYHFAILFEALFILTAVDAGTRSARFMLQDLLGVFHSKFAETDHLVVNMFVTALVVASWGYFLYQGVIDPKGGIYSLWPLFGIANQMLAAIALMLCAVVLFKMKRDRSAWVAVFPMSWLLIVTMYAGWLKVFSKEASIGFFAGADKIKETMATYLNDPQLFTNGLNLVIEKIKETNSHLSIEALDNLVNKATYKGYSSVGQIKQVIFNSQLNGVLTLFFMAVIVALLVFSIRTIIIARQSDKPSANEVPYEPFPEKMPASH